MDKIKIEPEEYVNQENTLFHDCSVSNFTPDHEVKVEIKEEVIPDVKIESQVEETKGILYRLLEGAKPQETAVADVTILSGSCDKTNSGETITEYYSAGSTCKCIKCNMLLFGDNIINHICDNGEESITCNICSRTFTELSLLLEHKLIHVRKVPLKCSICKKFNESSNVVKHIQTYSRKITYRTTCLSCIKSYNAKTSPFENNIPTHSGENRLNCDICGKSFNYRSNVINHMRIHTGERPFECNICNKSFCHISNLNSHLKIHEEKATACNLCGKRFLRQCNLNDHLRRHHADKTYRCEYCGKSFSELSKHVRHVRTHTGEKPFTCNYCSKTYYDKFSLNRHIQLHTGEKSLK